MSVLAPALEIPAPQERSIRDSLALLRHNPRVLVGGALTLLFLIVGVAGIIILLTPSLHYLYETQNLTDFLAPPFSPGHILGTDNFGEDLAWRCVVGTGISLAVGFAVTGISVVIGVIVGTTAGFYGGWLDRSASGLIDVTWGFPLLLVAVIVVGIMQPGLPAVIVAVALVMWAGIARVIRAETISLRRLDFVEAATALGVSKPKIIARHIVPNTVGTILTMSTYYIAYTVIIEAGLSFIGLGIQYPTPSLGQLIYAGTEYYYNDAWFSIIPGIFIVLIVLGLNTLGDGLRDVFDPRSRRW